MKRYVEVRHWCYVSWHQCYDCYTSKLLVIFWLSWRFKRFICSGLDSANRQDAEQDANVWTVAILRDLLTNGSVPQSNRSQPNSTLTGFRITLDNGLTKRADWNGQNDHLTRFYLCVICLRLLSFGFDSPSLIISTSVVCASRWLNCQLERSGDLITPVASMSRLVSFRLIQMSDVSAWHGFSVSQFLIRNDWMRLSVFFLYGFHSLLPFFSSC